MRTLVTFRCNDFNTSEPKEFFINPECFGDDVAKWMIKSLQEQGSKIVSTPKQEDFGWYFTFLVENIQHDFVIGFRPGDESTEGDWIGWFERKRGFIGSLFGLRKHGIQPDAVQAIHAVLSTSPWIRYIRWHFRTDFDGGREDLGSQAPLGEEKGDKSNYWTWKQR